ncbi:MAG: hypothetical protein ACJLS3_03625 [Erythrobacter sp.]
MTSLPKRYVEDKALRDAAKGVLEADVAHFKAALAEQGIAGRVGAQITGKVKNRITAGAHDVIEQAKSAAEDHRGVLAVLVGALILWLAREPLLGLLGLDNAPGEAELDADADEAMDETEGN